ncbi:MAG: hypothetical protein NZL91_03810 [Thermoflexales bacterium]|nr:hypothetical protein [Thermoflexales bacterium]MDW8291739.1 hypothetical protein [Anaerolineae bacterium]
MKLSRLDETTRLQIDFDWFVQQGQEVNVLLARYLPPEQQAQLSADDNTLLDFVDEQTGEVYSVPRAVQLVREHCAHDPNFIRAGLPIAEAVFRLLLINANRPMSAAEIAACIGRKPSEVLAQISGRVVYNGIKPVSE